MQMDIRENTCTTGCRYWAILGLKPIQTPTGTQITEAPATTTATRKNVRKPRPNACQRTLKPCCPAAM